MKKILLSSSLIAIVVFGVPSVGALAKEGLRGGNSLIELSKNFTKIDINGDGSLSSGEIITYSKVQMTALDTNGDGVVDADELSIKIIQRIKTMAADRRARMIAKVDKDGSVTLGADEFPGIGVPEHTLERIDRNEDGALSIEELTAA